MMVDELYNHFAPMHMARCLSRVRTVRGNDIWMIADIAKKGRQLVQAAGLDISPNGGDL